MNSSVPINHFDRGKPFYPLVMHYLVLLIGFKDLTGRGVINELHKLSTSNSGVDIATITRSILNRISVSETDKTQLEQQLAEINSSLSKVLGPLQLKSEFQSNHIKVEVDDIANDLMTNASYLIRFFMRSAGSLLILAHEISKDEPWHDKGPLWEFLRHCRNAAAHGGLFKIDVHRGEPRHLAEWGRFRIEATLHDTPLFKDETGWGLLSPGDPIRLLWDIEQAYPSMNA